MCTAYRASFRHILEKVVVCFSSFVRNNIIIIIIIIDVAVSLLLWLSSSSSSSLATPSPGVHLRGGVCPGLHERHLAQHRDVCAAHPAAARRHRHLPRHRRQRR